MTPMNTEKINKIVRRRFEGTVVSGKGQKTVVVKVESVKMHPRYHKRYVMSKRYKAHDEKNEYATGDTVIIEECRPLSKEKRFRVIGKVAKV